MKFNFKQSLAVLPSLQPAYDLFRRCEKYDNYMPKTYWHTLHERQYDHQAMDYLCFADDRLVGMLNILFFSETAELTVIVDPDFRGQKIFKKLRQIALAKLKNYVVSHYMLISPFKCTREDAVWDHDEIEMRPVKNFSEKNPVPVKDPLIISRASLDEINILADIHIECFEKPTHQAMVERFSTTLREPNRKAFIARNSQGEPIGKLHAREDFNRVYIHDVGICKAFRRQGFGRNLMLTWLAQHGNDYLEKPLAVEVLGDNTAALKLYESCGFEITNTYHFWKFKIP